YQQSARHVACLRAGCPARSLGGILGRKLVHECRAGASPSTEMRARPQALHGRRENLQNLELSLIFARRLLTPVEVVRGNSATGTVRHASCSIAAKEIRSIEPSHKHTRSLAWPSARFDPSVRSIPVGRILDA